MNRKGAGIGSLTIMALTTLPILGCGLWVETLPSGVAPSPSPFDRFVQVQGVNIHYEAYAGSGETVVLLHGFGSSTYTWREVIPVLQQAGLRVYALDIKGSGWSEKPIPSDYSPEGLTRSVLDWMDVMGIERCILGGNSLGGGISLMVALEAPERVQALVLLDAAGYPKTKPFLVRVSGSPMARWLVKPFFGEALIRVVMKEVFFAQEKVTRERINAYYDRLRTENALDVLGLVAAGLTDEKAQALSSRFKEIHCPVLVLWGEEDRWIPVSHAHRFHEDLPQSSLVLLPACGHVPQEERPLETGRAMVDFVKNVGLMVPVDHEG